MRRLVFTSDDGQHTGEIGLDNDGNLYLRGAAGKSIRLLQDTSSEGDYVPVADNFYNISSVIVHSAGYVVLGNQVLVVLAITKTVVDENEQTEFDLTLPFPPAFTGDNREAVPVFGIDTVTPDAVTGKVRLLELGNPFLPGANQYQMSFCYRSK